ncbi:hypothetical protein MLD38_035713 [Melastoma candidum]|uniref:Uncharacterized protein n=1 Tax=Melastoma candidum TaxID=119954 RepID=A0ACB9LHV7_9MYRT|nr:hypothetical protein MLD38_035713 [Melastoma candidum]
MAANSFHHLQCHHRHHSNGNNHCPRLDPSPPTPPPSLFLKPRPPSAAVKYSPAAFSLSPATSSSSAAAPVSPSTPKDDASYDALRESLASGDFRQADEVTRRLLIVLAGEQARKRGYVFFSEVQFIPADDLRAIDQLWREHSGGRFGYSVQKTIWEKANRDFTVFFVRVGWMKKLDTEVQQYNYRSFPGEFVWELNNDTPLGHLPLTNALRGTQLLTCILTHPAFEEAATEEEEDNTGVKDVETGGDASKDGSSASKALKNNRGFKTDYSF